MPAIKILRHPSYLADQTGPAGLLTVALELWAYDATYSGPSIRRYALEQMAAMREFPCYYTIIRMAASALDMDPRKVAYKLTERVEEKGQACFVQPLCSRGGCKRECNRYERGMTGDYMPPNRVTMRDMRCYKAGERFGNKTRQPWEAK